MTTTASAVDDELRDIERQLSAAPKHLGPFAKDPFAASGGSGDAATDELLASIGRVLAPSTSAAAAASSAASYVAATAVSSSSTATRAPPQGPLPSSSSLAAAQARYTGIEGGLSTGPSASRKQPPSAGTAGAESFALDSSMYSIGSRYGGTASTIAGTPGGANLRHVLQESKDDGDDVEPGVRRRWDADLRVGGDRGTGGTAARAAWASKDVAPRSPPQHSHTRVKAAAPDDDGGRAYDGSFQSLVDMNLSDVSGAPSQNSRAVMAALRTLQDKIRRLTSERAALSDEYTAVQREFAEVR